MRSNNFISYALFSGAYANVVLQPSPAVADPTITAPPISPAELLRRQNDERFMGWLQYSSGAEWSSEDCDVGGTLYQSGDNWRCCSTTANGCSGPVGCISGSLIYDMGTTGTNTGQSTYACSAVYTGSAEAQYSLCNTGFLFQNTADSDPQTNVFCGISANNWSYYRQKPDDPTTSTSSTSESSTPASTEASTTKSSATSTGTAAPAPKSGGSKAWIAGAVVGPILGIALIGLGIWFCMRRRNKIKNNTTAAAGVVAGGAGPSHPGSPQSGPQQPYNYQPMQQTQDQPGFVPYGVGVAEQKPQSNTYAYNVGSQSPGSNGPGSPQPQPYQNYNNYNEGAPGSPQMLDSHLANPMSYPQGQGASPTLSPAQGQGGPNVPQSERPFSSELDSNPSVPQAHHAAT